jgi:23S rRNA (guanosine2251-2'-O)-methyltransferase
MREWIYGRNAVYETLRARRRQLFRLLLAQGVQPGGRLAEIRRMCTQRKVGIELVPRSRLDSLGSNHQGLALEASGYPYVDVADFVNLAQQRGEPLFVLILDTLQDPQNLGALLRTAEIVGVHGVLLPLRRTATVTPAVVNASAGASEHLLVAQANLSQGIEKLKQSGAWVIGLEDSPRAQTPDAIRLDGPLAIVVGNEAEGIRPLVRASCDLLMRLPMRGQVESYNAAVAGSIALFLAYRANTRN